LGIAEDVLVKVGHHFIPVDFVVLEMGGREKPPLILGSPGHKIPRTETEPDKTENRTEKYRTEKIRFLFGSRSSGTEFTEVNSVFTLGLPKYLICY
jgi:hypothetical protein